jgi:hypothetical protein
VRLLVTGLAAVAPAGGGGDDAAAPAKPAKRPADPCSARMTAAAGPGAHATVVSRGPDVVTCRYEGHAGKFRVIVDTAPHRWTRGQVERIQTASEWAHTPEQQARDVPGIGGGAFWVCGPRELVTSDGKKLLTVRVERPHSDRLARLRRSRSPAPASARGTSRSAPARKRRPLEYGWGRAASSLP